MPPGPSGTETFGSSAGLEKCSQHPEVDGVVLQAAMIVVRKLCVILQQ